MVASILGLTAADSSFTGSSLGSGASVSDGAVDAAVVAAAGAPPVTSSLSFWFSSLNERENENDNVCEQGPFPEFVEALDSFRMSFGKNLWYPPGAMTPTESSGIIPHQKWKHGQLSTSRTMSMLCHSNSNGGLILTFKTSWETKLSQFKKKKERSEEWKWT